MSDSPLDKVADELAHAREGSDALNQAYAEQSPDPGRVQEVLGHLRAILRGRSTCGQLRSDLEVVHGLVASLIGRKDATRLLQELPDIRRCISLDLEAAFQGDPAASSYAEILACYPSSIAVSTYRIAHAFYGLGHTAVARIMSERAHSDTGIDIHPGARIGCHFFIDHGTGVVIGETCQIGNRVKLYHGVTLGAFSNRHGRGDLGKKRHPTIEDDVTIYPNATILGGDTVIGERCVVGGNVWLIESLPPDTRVSIEVPRLQVRRRNEDPRLADYEI